MFSKEVDGCHADAATAASLNRLNGGNLDAVLKQVDDAALHLFQHRPARKDWNLNGSVDLAARYPGR
jgi:hypothetical protein